MDLAPIRTTSKWVNLLIGPKWAQARYRWLGSSAISLASSNLRLSVNQPYWSCPTGNDCGVGVFTGPLFHSLQAEDAVVSQVGSEERASTRIFGGEDQAISECPAAARTTSFCFTVTATHGKIKHPMCSRSALKWRREGRIMTCARFTRALIAIDFQFLILFFFPPTKGMTHFLSKICFYFKPLGFVLVTNSNYLELK